MIHIKIIIYCISALATLVIGCRSKQPSVPVYSKVKGFNYTTDDEIKARVILKNLPADVNRYTLYYHAECAEEDGNIEEGRCSKCAEDDDYIKKVGYIEGSRCSKSYRSYVTEGGIPALGEIYISKKLVQGIKGIKYYINLFQNEKLCSNKKVLEGVLSSDKSHDTSTEPCLKATGTRCQIDFDFNNKCDELQEYPVSKCYFNGSSIYICENDNLPEDTCHQWHQVNNNSNLDIGTVAPLYGKKSQFIIKIMKFDNNTAFYNEIYQTGKKLEQPNKNKLKFIPNYSISFYSYNEIIPYNEFTTVIFDCRIHELLTNYVQVGLIDPSGDIITTHHSSILKRKFNEIEDYTSLCCIYYVVTRTETVEKVERFVDNMTLLQYDSQATSDDPSELVENGNDAPASTYYIVAAVVGTVFLIVLFLVINKRFGCTKHNSIDAMATYTSPNAVTYAELDIRPVSNQEINTTEESPYAEIIGVLKPAR